MGIKAEFYLCFFFGTFLGVSALSCYSCSNLQYTSDTLQPNATAILGSDSPVLNPNPDCAGTDTSLYNSTTCSDQTGKTTVCTYTTSATVKLDVGFTVGFVGASRDCSNWNTSLAAIPTGSPPCVTMTVAIAEAMGMSGVTSVSGNICACTSNNCNGAGTNPAATTTAAPGGNGQGGVGQISTSLFLLCLAPFSAFSLYN